MNASLKIYIASFVVILFCSFFTSEARPEDRSILIKRILQSIQQRYAPDQRTAVFNISYKLTRTGIVLIGEVDTLAAKNTLIEALHKNLKEDVIDSICVLPGLTLGNNRTGIVIIDVGDVRKEPRKQGELVTQVLMGTVVKLLKKVGGYCYIQMPDQYLGWIDTTLLYMTDQTGLKTWNTAHKVITTELKCNIRKTPDSTSAPLCNAVVGCILRSDGKNSGWTMVELANGQKGFIQASFVQDLEGWEKSRTLTGVNLEKTAKALFGIPYLWGGTSVKGMDCSGFVKTVYRLNGVELQRDADQQANQGIHIEPGKNFENLQKGDLLFFCQRIKGRQPKRITHVALSLGNKLFSHSTVRGCVQIGSFDPSSEYFEKSLLNRFVVARRIVQK